jgi:hypothetical protein
MNFDEFIDTAWNDHADRPQDVADRLAASLRIIETTDQIPPFARLATHVFGEHLGQWRRGIFVLDALRDLPAFDNSAIVTGVLARSVAVLRYASGDHDSLTPLAHEDRVAVLATASSAFAGRDEFKQAISAYAEAVRLAQPGLPSGSPAIRALAVGGNNLAAALEGKKDRDAVETKGMIAAAEGGLAFWKRAGTWLEEERAEYRLTRSLLEAGEYAAALQSARRCIAVCTANDAPAFEQFFGYAALALVQRAAGDAIGFEGSRKDARRMFDLVASNEKPWCKAEIDELGDCD